MSTIDTKRAKFFRRVRTTGVVMVGLLALLTPVLWWFSPAIDFYQGSLAVWQSQTARVVSLEFTADSKTLVSLGEEGRVQVWDCESWKERPFDLALRWKVRTCRLSPDGKLLAVVCDNDDSVYLVDLAKMQVSVRLDNAKGTFIDGMQFSQDGNQLVMHYGDEYKFMVWSLTEQCFVAELFVKGSYGNFALHPNGRNILTHGAFPGVQEYELKTGIEVKKFADEDQRFAPMIGAIVITPDQKSVLTTTWRGFVAEWDLASGELKRFVRAHFYGAGFDNLAVSNDGTMMVTTEEVGNFADLSEMRVWDLKDFSLISEFRTPRPFSFSWAYMGYRCLAISPNQQQLAAGHNGGWISVRRMPHAVR